MSSDIDDSPGPNPFLRYMRPYGIPNIFENAASYIRENIVLPFRKKERPVYYHRQFERVPTIDQCYTNDPLCRYEAQEQFLRDKKVDMFKIRILRRRWTECNYYWGESRREKCMKERTDFVENSVNYFLRYGDVGKQFDSLENYMKQKHRMIWMRRKQENGEEADYRD